MCGILSATAPGSADWILRLTAAPVVSDDGEDVGLDMTGGGRVAGRCRRRRRRPRERRAGLTSARPFGVLGVLGWSLEKMVISVVCGFSHARNGSEPRQKAT